MKDFCSAFLLGAGLVVQATTAFAAGGTYGGDQLPNGPRIEYGRPNSTPGYYDLCTGREQEITRRVEDCRLAMTPGREGHNARLYVVIGTIYSDAGQRDLAASAFDQAIALDPENEKAWSGKCRTEILAAKNPDAAGADCEKAARLDSHDADVLDSSGIAQFRLGHMDAAFEDFNAAIRTSFKRPGSFFLRGVVEHRLGRAAEGDADIQTALSLDPAIGKTVAGYGIAP